MGQHNVVRSLASSLPPSFYVLEVRFDPTRLRRNSSFILFCPKFSVRASLISFIHASLTKLAVELCAHITPLVTGPNFQLTIGTVLQPFHAVPVQAMAVLVLSLLCA